MATYSLTAINVGSFNLGESDRLLTIFSPERGLLKVVAKGARKPGAKMTGKSELLNVNTLLLSKGKTLDIITQAESLESFPALRKDLIRLTFALYYAELTQAFGQGVSEDAQEYFAYLRQALKQMCVDGQDPMFLCLKFELGLLQILGYQPELTYCVLCRQVLTDYTLSAFHQDWGGIICRICMEKKRPRQVQEDGYHDHEDIGYALRASVQITPLVWKQLALAAGAGEYRDEFAKPSVKAALQAARRLIQGYLEHRAGRKLKSLDLVKSLPTS